MAKEQSEDQDGYVVDDDEIMEEESEGEGEDEEAEEEEEEEEDEEEEEEEEEVEEEEEEEVEVEVEVEAQNHRYSESEDERLPNSSPLDQDMVHSSGISPISVTLTDPDVLDCSICFLPLTIPVFQCGNGHIACSSCCNKIRNVCSSCTLPIGYNRCRAIEKVLESIRISCRNITYGCKETLIYSKKYEHELTCIYEACSCPHPGCDFVASYKQLYIHYTEHKNLGSAISFSCDHSFTVPIKLDMEFVVLQESVDKTLFVLNCGVQSIGIATNITCIAPNSIKKGLSYKLIAHKGDSTVKLESYTQSLPRWSKHLPCQTFLLIPSDFLDSSGMHHLEVLIRRKLVV